MSAGPQLIALAGVVVGGAITAFAQQLRPNARNVQGAARLLREEFDLTATYASEVLEAGAWQPNGRAFSDEVWSDRRSLLAAELGRSDWTAVIGAHHAVQALVPPRAGREVLDSLS